MSRSRRTTVTSVGSSKGTDWNWKCLRGTPVKTFKYDYNGDFKKDELNPERFERYNFVLNKAENKSAMIRDKYVMLRDVNEMLSWCDEFMKK